MLSGVLACFSSLRVPQTETAQTGGTVSTIYSEDQALRNAVRWISDQRQTGSSQPLSTLVQEAIFRFDLTPNQGEYLLRFYREGADGSAPS